MKVIEISDELYEKLKNCVVDPFDDTPEFVISRLIDTVEKAKDRWCSWDADAEDAEQTAEAQANPPKKRQRWKEQTEAVL